MAHVQRNGTDSFDQSLLGIRVSEQHGLQPGVAEFDEVPARRRSFRRRTIQSRGTSFHHRSGNSSGQRELSDEGNCGELAYLSDAWPGLRESRLADHELWPAL